MEQQSHDFFINYSRKDIDKARRVAEALRNLGYSYFLDIDNVIGSVDYNTIFESAIKNCKAMIFISSKNSLKSSWVKAELNCAVNMSKKILPLIIDDTPYSEEIKMLIGDDISIDIQHSIESSSFEKAFTKILKVFFKDFNNQSNTPSENNQERPIFISYSRNDKAIVFPYVNQINKAVGRNCWIDLKGVESGAEFEEVIMKAIDGCQVVLFMLSDSSLQSKWTKREVYYAEDEGKRIVPILVNGEKLRGWFKFHFGNVDFININSEEQKKKLIGNLQLWLGIEKDELKQRTDQTNKKNADNIVVITDSKKDDILKSLGISSNKKESKKKDLFSFELDELVDDVEIYWEKFIEAILNKQVIPVIGPDIIRIGDNSFIQDFLIQMAKSLGIEDSYINSFDQLVFDVKFNKYRSNVNSIIAKSLDKYEDYIKNEVSCDIVSRLLATHFFPFVLTTTIDGMLESIMKKEYGDDLSVLVFDNNPTHIKMNGDIRKDDDLFKPTLYYMYGKASNNSFVLTDDDLRSFSKSWLSEEISPRYLRHALRNCYLLFLGYDYKNGIDSFFLQDLRLSGDSITRPKPIYEFIQKVERGIQEYPNIVINEIIRRIKEKTKEREKNKFDTPQQGVDVYISYSRSDSVIVQRLYESLTRIGLQVWYDKHNLLISGNYMDEIHKAIRTAKYFVPILSQNITKEKLESHFYRNEWNMAIDVAMSYGRTFIIPIAEEGFGFHESHLPEEMMRINAIYFSEESNFEGIAEKIVQIINRDKIGGDI